VSLKYPGGDLPNGGNATVTAITNVDVGPSPYYIEIFRVDPYNPPHNAYPTPTRVAICGGGTTCAVTMSFTETGEWGREADFVAYVSGNSTDSPPANTQATSNTIKIGYDTHWPGG
jgi:hypothetical protein